MATPELDALAPPRLEHFAHLQIDVAAPVVLGQGPQGLRRVVPILGGRAQGQGWTARVLPGGSDFQLFRSDTSSVLDARYALETDAGELIYVHNHALRAAPADVMAALMRGEPVDPTQVYFRCTPSFETSSASLAWINDRLFVGVGMRRPEQVLIRAFALL